METIPLVDTYVERLCGTGRCEPGRDPQIVDTPGVYYCDCGSNNGRCWWFVSCTSPFTQHVDFDRQVIRFRERAGSPYNKRYCGSVRHRRWSEAWST